LVRCSQLINNSRTFYGAYVLSVKRAPRPYKLGSRIVEVALQVRTATGQRLLGLDALSNAPCPDAELDRFKAKVPLDEKEVRKKIRSLQSAMQDHANLFEEEELRRHMEQDERLREKREEEARAAAQEEE